MTQDTRGPASLLPLLRDLGYLPLTPQSRHLRGGRHEALLTEILVRQLRRLNLIHHQGQTHEFSDSNLERAVQALRKAAARRPAATGAELLSLLCLGKSLPEPETGVTRSFPLVYLDLAKPERNHFHMAAEQDLQAERGQPDIVLYVNGIPLVVMGCGDEISTAVARLRRQHRLMTASSPFAFASLLVALAPEQIALTADAAAEHWVEWWEPEPAGDGQSDGLQHLPATRDHKRLLAALCRPPRLLELLTRFTLSNGDRTVVASADQYHCVQRILQRLRQPEPAIEPTRTSGVVACAIGKWQLMVMLAGAIAREPSIHGHRILLAVGHQDQIEQIAGAVQHWSEVPLTVPTGRRLARIIETEQPCLVLTVTGKLEALLATGKLVSDSPSIYALIDCPNPTNYQQLRTRARKVLPHASMILFSDTPVTQDQRQVITGTGGLLESCAAAESAAVYPIAPEPYAISTASATTWLGETSAYGYLADQIADRDERTQVPLAESFSSVIGVVLAADNELVALAAQGIEEIIQKLRVVGWTDSDDIQNQMRTAIEDLLFDLQEHCQRSLSFRQIDRIMEYCLAIACRRLP